MFKRFSLFILMIISALLMSSCFEVAVEIKLNRDGSGILKQKILFSEMMIAQMTGFAQSFSESEETSGEQSLYDEEKLKAEASSFGEGVEFLSGSEITENGKTGYEALYRFNDIRKIKISSNPESNIDMPASEGEKDNDFYEFDFIEKNDISRLTVIMNEAEEKTGDEAENVTGELSSRSENNAESADIDEASMEMMKQFFSGMKFSYKVNINGKITDTDALHKDGSSVTLIEVDFDRIMENPEAFAELENLQEGSQIETVKAMKDLEGIKAEMKDRIYVDFN